MRPVDRRLAVGDLWFVKLPDATAVVRAKILHLSIKTILIKGIRKEEGMTDFVYRFKLEDLEFVEFIEAETQSRVSIFPKESSNAS